MKYLVKFILNIFDYFTEKKIDSVLKKKLGKHLSCLVDVGSHKGEYIKKCLSLYNIDKIYGFEANPVTFKILLSNCKNKTNIFLNNYGVGEIKKKINLFQNIESSSSSFNQLNTDSNYFKKKYFFLNFFGKKKILNPVSVEVVRLKDFIIKKKIEKINLLKIDTEGYEFNVIKGLDSEIKNVHLIHLEHHFDDMIIKNYTLSDIHNYLENKGFKKIFKIKMKFRKSFEYIYQNQLFFNE